MNIERKYAAIARQEAIAIAEGRQWYPSMSRPALCDMGWLSGGDYPNNLFSHTPRCRLDVNEVLTALAMVIAVAKTSPPESSSQA